LLLERHKDIPDAISVYDKVFTALLNGHAAKVPNNAVVIDHGGTRKSNRLGSVDVDLHLTLCDRSTNGFKPNHTARRRLLRECQHRKCRKNENRNLHSLDREN
jgi:hypothetical protein